MRVSPAGVLTWVAAFTAVLAFYAHTIFSVPTTVATPICAAVIATALVGLALAGLVTGHLAAARTPARQASALCLWLALGGFAVSAAAGWIRQGVSINDFGLFAVEVGTPALLILSDRRNELLGNIGKVCVAFATVDMVVNVLAASGVVQLVQEVGAAGSRVYGLHFLGLAGNSDAAGLVAFIGVAFLAIRIPAERDLKLLLRLTWIFGLLVSLYLIGARRYLGLGVAASLLLAFRWTPKISPLLTIAAVAAAALAFTFGADFADVDNQLRARLMADGLRNALAHPFLGVGVHYRDPYGLQATYQSLKGAGVTESGVFDLAIAFGILSTALFLLSSVFALIARRPIQSWAAVVLTLLTAELAFGDALSGFLGAIVFYGALIYCQRDEWTEIESATAGASILAWRGVVGSSKAITGRV